MAERQADLLPVGYFHVVFTLPAEVAAIAFGNKAVVYDLLFKTASETMMTIAADPKHLGARIGITAVLHTWGSALTHHPHIHMIVPGGGLSLDGQRWVSSRPAFLLPVRVLGKLFRRLFLMSFEQSVYVGQTDANDIAVFRLVEYGQLQVRFFKTERVELYDLNGWEMQGIDYQDDNDFDKYPDLVNAAWHHMGQGLIMLLRSTVTVTRMSPSLYHPRIWRGLFSRGPLDT